MASASPLGEPQPPPEIVSTIAGNAFVFAG
jgi:hypothetical protein